MLLSFVFLIIKFFLDFNILFGQLKYLEDDLKDFFPKNEVGKRIKFRNSLRKWKLSLGVVNPEPDSSHCVVGTTGSSICVTTTNSSVSESPNQYVSQLLLQTSILEYVLILPLMLKVLVKIST